VIAKPANDLIPILTRFDDTVSPAKFATTNAVGGKNLLPASQNFKRAMATSAAASASEQTVLMNEATWG
jgi:hypothetical protein